MMQPLILGVLLLAVPGGEPYRVQQLGPASLWISHPVAQGKITLGLADELTIRIELDGADIRQTLAWVASPGWQTRRLDDGKQPRVVRLGLTPISPTINDLRLEPLRWKGGEAIWTPLPIAIRTSMSNPSLDDLRDITSIEVPQPSDLAWLWWLAPVLGAPILLLLWRYWPRSKHQALSPHAWLHRELDRLQRRQLQPASAIILLSRIVAEYLERRFEAPCRRWTTPELMNLVREKMPPEQVESLRTFFDACDAVKYGGAPVTDEDVRRLFKTREVIE